MPPVNGTAKRFFRNALRRSSFASIVSSSACFAATTAPIYFTKLTPHFSHFTPVRCLLPHEGHSKRIVMWQRWQKRATSRTAAPHLGQGIVACGVGVAVGSQVFATIGLFCRASLVRTAACASTPGALGSGVAPVVTLGSPLGGLLPFGPEDESPAMAHLTGCVRWMRAPRRTVRPHG